LQNEADAEPNHRPHRFAIEPYKLPTPRIAYFWRQFRGVGLSGIVDGAYNLPAQRPTTNLPIGYYEFEHENRPQGWNVWLTFAISPEAEKPATSTPPRIRK
jgi:hypothetical protein